MKEVLENVGVTVADSKQKKVQKTVCLSDPSRWDQLGEEDPSMSYVNGLDLS